MKKYFFLIGLILGFTLLFGQSPITKGKIQLNSGFGFSTFGFPFYVGADYGAMTDITMGGEISYRSYHDSFSYFDYSHNIIGIITHANYHFNSLLDLQSKYDLYAGINIGFYYWDSPSNYFYKNDFAHGSGPGFGVQVGARYYLTKKFGLNAELSGGVPLVGGKFGVSYKL